MDNKLASFDSTVSQSWKTGLVRFLEPFFQPPKVQSTLHVTIDGGGSAITTGVKGEATIHFPCYIAGWTLLADQSGSIVVDIWKADYSSFPPTVANTITAAAQPTLSSAIKNKDTVLTGWTHKVASGDTFRFHVDSASTVTRVHLALQLHKPPKT